MAKAVQEWLAAVGTKTAYDGGQAVIGAVAVDRT